MANWKEEYISTIERFNAFKEELKELSQKYKISIYESANYDGNEEYCGSDYFIKVDSKVIYDDTLNEVIDECFRS